MFLLKSRFIFFLVVLVVGCSIYPSSSNDCNSLLSKKLHSDSLVLDLNQLVQCELGMDSFNLQYGGPYYLQIIQNLNEEDATYGDFLKSFKKFKKGALYLQYKNQVYPDYMFKDRLAKIENWTEDSLALSKMNAPEEFLRNYKPFVKTHADGKTKHGVLLQQFKTKNKL